MPNSLIEEVSQHLPCTKSYPIRFMASLHSIASIKDQNGNCENGN